MLPLDGGVASPMDNEVCFILLPRHPVWGWRKPRWNTCEKGFLTKSYPRHAVPSTGTPPHLSTEHFRRTNLRAPKKFPRNPVRFRQTALDWHVQRILQPLVWCSHTCSRFCTQPQPQVGGDGSRLVERADGPQRERRATPLNTPKYRKTP